MGLVTYGHCRIVRHATTVLMLSKHSRFRPNSAKGSRVWDSFRSIETNMAVITILIEPDCVTRILFDCCDAAPDPRDQRRIELAIEESLRRALGGRGRTWDSDAAAA